MKGRLPNFVERTAAARAERLRETNYPDTAAHWKGDSLQRYGGDTLLGEIARQLGWSRLFHDLHVRVKEAWREDDRVLSELGLGRDRQS